MAQVMMSLTHGTAVGLPGRVPVDLRPSHAPAATRATRRSEDRDWCRVHFRVKLWEIPNLVMTNSSPWLSHGPNRFIDGLPVYLLIAWWIFPWRTVKEPDGNCYNIYIMIIYDPNYPYGSTVWEGTAVHPRVTSSYPSHTSFQKVRLDP